MNVKKNIIVLIRHYLPGYKMGGPLTSILNMIYHLSNEFDFRVLTLDRDLGEKKPYSNVSTKKWLNRTSYLICYVPKNIFTTYHLIRQINKTPADIVYINSFFDPIFSITIVIAKNLSLINSLQLIIAPRGELFDEALNFKKSKKSVYLSIAKALGIYRDIIWHASTEMEKDSIIKTLNINPDKVKVAFNMSAFSEDQIDPKTNNLNNFEANDDQDLNIVFLSRISKDKNIAFTFDVLHKITAKVSFDIYGPIEDQYIWNICLEKIKELPPNIKVNYLGSVNQKDVKNILVKYDVFFLPTFSENYGHAIVESLSVGTPVLISDKTPWRNLKTDKLGWDISLNSPDLFVAAINEALSYSKTQRIQNRDYIKTVFKLRLNDPAILKANKELFYLPFLN